MLVKTAVAIAGGDITQVSKMPCFTYNLNAIHCKVGQMMRKKYGLKSVCGSCYTFKGLFMLPSVQKSMARHLEAIARVQWVEAMCILIARKGPYFRWHSSGDLQSMKHLLKIVEIAKRLPNVQFWLPTKEYGTVSRYLRSRVFPSNLTVRVSAPFLDQMTFSLKNQPVSFVVTEAANTTCHVTRNPDAKNCGSCRDCWNADKAVSYLQH